MKTPFPSILEVAFNKLVRGIRTLSNHKAALSTPFRPILYPISNQESMMIVIRKTNRFKLRLPISQTRQPSFTASVLVSRIFTKNLEIKNSITKVEQNPNKASTTL